MPTSHSPSRGAPRLGSAPAPAEALGAHRARPRRGARRERRAARSGRASGSIAQPQLDRVDAQLVRPARRSRFRARTCRPTRRAPRMKVLASMSMSTTLLHRAEAVGGVEVRGRAGELLGQTLCGVVRRRRRCGSAPSSRPSAPAPSATRCSVGVRPPIGAVDALAGQHQPHRPAGQLRRRGGQDLVVATAPCRRSRRRRTASSHAPGPSSMPNTLASDRAVCAEHLRGVVHGQLVALPFDGRGVQLDRRCGCGAASDRSRRRDARAAASAALRVADLDAAARPDEARLGLALGLGRRRSRVAAGSAS